MLLWVIHDLAQLKAADPWIRGVVGDNFLEHFDLLIDNRRHILCLDDSKVLVSAQKGKRVPLANPHGAQDYLPFTRPLIVSARLSQNDSTSVLLRLDSATDSPLLYVAGTLSRKNSGLPGLPMQDMQGMRQRFAVFPPQDLWIGTDSVRNLSFAVPMHKAEYSPAPFGGRTAAHHGISTCLHQPKRWLCGLGFVVNIDLDFDAFATSALSQARDTAPRRNA